MKHLVTICWFAQSCFAQMGIYPSTPWVSTNLLTLTNTTGLQTAVYQPQWADSMIPAAGFKLGSSAPAWGNFTDANIQILRFPKTGTTSVHGSVQLNHDYVEGTDIVPHIHVWFPTAGISGAQTNVWSLTYSWANINAAFPSSTTIYVTNTTVVAINEHKIVSFGTLSGTGKKISSIFALTLSRIGGDAYDIYDDVIGLLGFDLHYQVNSLGSNNETSK